ncbi:MAG: alpha/beta hydrolase [Acidimicrobiia bacterium]
MSSLRLRALLAACMLALAACSSGGSAAQADRSRPFATANGSQARSARALHWTKCGDRECATLRVPLDPASPGGKQISLALARVRAGKPDERIGSLVVNPGGPGAPGTDFVPSAASDLPKAITDRFDIVGWDPRGSGSSAPVDCGKHLDYLFDVDTAPDNPAEQTALETASRRFAQACEQHSRELLSHISSLDTVHDLDRIRKALGEDKLSFAGYSYGTYLGALYAQTYPTHVRAMVLDGAIDPAVAVDEVSIQQAKGFESSLDAFLEDCARHQTCAFHHNGNPRAALDALRARVERQPIRGSDGRVLGPTQLDIGIAAPLYAGAGGYSALAGALRDAERGKPSKMLELFDEYVLRSPDGTYAPDWPAFLAISCLDGPDLDIAAAEALQQRAATEAPHFGASNVGLSLACSYWPVPPVNAAPTPVSAPGAPPIVVVGTTGDPATPIAWADGLARQLDARLITVDGTTHTSSLDGNRCLDAATARYLINLHPPRPGLHCRA